jgi:8-oxo-dGTP diphosphatase
LLGQAQHGQSLGGHRCGARWPPAPRPNLFTFDRYLAAVPIYLVRHAKAGSRHDFDGDDRDRPLTNAGRKQAAVLATRLAAISPTLIVSSPYRRCIETVEPLAVAIDGEVQMHEALGEFATEQSRPGAALMTLLLSVPDRAVLCSHGDVIPAIINSFGADGMHIDGTPQWGKASVWLLQREAQRFVAAQAWPPPDVD